MDPDVDETPESRGRALARPRFIAIVAGACIVLGGSLVWWSPWSSELPEAEVAAATTTSTTDPEDAGSDLGDLTAGPLTGLPVAEGDTVRLLRPALVAKIDGAPEAMPQTGLSSADIVMEVRVEGISRYLGIWHSQDVATIGPVRSARTTDPDILAGYGRPLFAYSGGNTGVIRDLRRSDWFTDVGHDAAPDAYVRTPERRAPHDLMADTSSLWDRTPAELAVPPAQFTYGDPVASQPGAAPVPGFAVSVGSNARFVWDDGTRLWRRWAHGIPHTDVSGEPLGFDNVVVLEVEYVRSAADHDSPEAVSVGSGPAWVFNEGAVAAGTWNRPDRTGAWNLTDESGAPLSLVPGTTWVVLADAEPVPIAETEVLDLLEAD